jgi:hypothetical protein
MVEIVKRFSTSPAIKNVRIRVRGSPVGAAAGDEAKKFLANGTDHW